MSNMKYKNFEEFFYKATEYTSFPYQRRLAELDTMPSVINVPTGTGKTAAAILGLWLWKRLNNKENTPRRLIYCLPMRVLVEQTKSNVEEWLKNLGLEKRMDVELIMGGSESKIQKINPDKECIIIGTQDMLVSGALNRAYGNSPSVWPIVFGLLNNDCMWIMDEVQIMENTLPTSIQLNYFRNHFKTYGPHKTVWMSATINPDWLETVDSPNSNLKIFHLEEKDIDNEFKKRNEASKTLHKLEDITIKKEYSKKDVQSLLKLHKSGTTTAIIVNTVQRAQGLYKILLKENVNCKLIHSRFRGIEREKLNKDIMKLKETDDLIIVSTQVLEAGVDISVRTMITEIAPWSNLVQRFGRCNRYGNMSESDVYWIDLDKNAYPPYDEDALNHVRDKLKNINKSISPHNLPDIRESKFFDAVLRHRDIINLFDTTSDLSGNHTDVSKFVRNMSKSLDVHVFWRDNIDDNQDKFKPERDEICSVSISSLKEFLKKKNGNGRVWDYIDEEWKKIYHRDLFPGQTIMLDSKIGGYSDTLGWDVEIKDKVIVLKEKSQQMPESHNGDQLSQSNKPVTLEDHTKHVLIEIESFLKNISYLENDIKNVICTAIKYHDIGKTHRVFQQTMLNGMHDTNNKENTIWAKCEKGTRHSRPGFRHEVASALVYLKQKEDNISKEFKNLTAYLIMSHHGKVRLSLRNPIRKKSSKQDTEYILGMKISGDILPGFSCSEVSIEETSFDMSLANIGRKDGNPSWAERAIALRDNYGPFRLAYLETLIRRADWLASAKENEGGYK